MSRNIISVLIKPASSKCSMACTYCFYHAVSLRREVNDYGFMSIETAEKLILHTLNFASSGNVYFVFQGGEPLLRGLGFYYDFIDFVNSNNVQKSKVHYSIQTNGLHIDSSWAVLFKEHNFLLGLSLDGTQETNNKFRLDRNGYGTFNNIMRGLYFLKKHNVNFNILTVINSITANSIEEIYDFYKKQNFRYLQFIPCIDIKESKEFFSLNPSDYGSFLKILFDLWEDDIINGRLISIRYFDNILMMFLGLDPESCVYRGTCHLQNVVEADGKVYPCDFFTRETDSIGNIKIDSFHQIYRRRESLDFLKDSYREDYACSCCEWYKLCRNGCMNDRLNGKNRFCVAYKDFYSYSHLKFKRIANAIKRRNERFRIPLSSVRQ